MYCETCGESVTSKFRAIHECERCGEDTMYATHDSLSPWTHYLLIDETTGQTIKSSKFINYTCHRIRTHNCTTCGGDGKVDQEIECKHGKSSSHLYCSHDHTELHD